ncbi:MAG TPA: sugar transferase [Acidimicrobiales bacterium]|nr:sugar transferase [Acidimicrobiales bacterium]
MAVSDDVASSTLRTVRSPRPRRDNRLVPRVPVEQRTHLRAILLAADTAAIGLAWALTLVPWPYSGRPEIVSLAVAAALTGLGVWILHLNGLYLARNATMRTMEMARIGRSVLILGIVAWAGSRVFDIPLGSGHLNGEVTVGTLATLAFLLVSRSTYRAWLTTSRRNGQFVRDVLVVGTNAEAAELVNLFADHTELGFRVAGVLGDRDEAIAHELGNLWCGGPGDAARVLAARQATGVVVAMGTLDSDALTELVRTLHLAGAHVHISSGLRRIDHRRLRALPLAYEPLFYVEPWALPHRQLVIKRALDIATSGLALVVAAPVMLVIAALIKLNDRGPVLFKQTRVGTDGELFKVYKFRTMVVDAEARLASLAASNERTGPLFKMDRDPRVTRVGRFLRASSLDELPQILNVLKGDMSLVGPRPALPAEVASFDEELRDRTKVKPGITGLWQIEARDNPSFSAYRRLDLYYVENWSVSLDIVILFATIEHVITRFVTAVFGRR